MQLDGWAKFNSLSSGMKRRVLLAQAIVDRLMSCYWMSPPTTRISIYYLAEGFQRRTPARCCSSPTIALFTGTATRILKLIAAIYLIGP